MQADKAAQESHPLKESHPLTVVGVGASAGGLAALRALLSSIPAEPGVAMVIVVHLSPNHESHLAALLQPHCPMPVQQVVETTKLEPNRVYVIPPNANLMAIDTHLRLTELEPKRAERAPIDHFFHTLANTNDGRSVGIVLTGTGSDGTLGLRHIKQAGGLAIAQDPAEAEHDGMPRSAITAGAVDLVLPISRMASEIQRYSTTYPQVAGVSDGEDLPGDENRILQKIFAQVRAQTGHDFSYYRRSTALRRIQRRMQLHHLTTLGDYLEVLRRRREEAVELYDDLLITVTEFFRDQKVFEHLQKKVIPSIFDKKGVEDRIRVWSVGCSTGEEAYSIAIVLLEEAARREFRPQIQVFASDLHEATLSRAREGVYPEEIARNVEASRLEKHFSHESGHYRVGRDVREMIIFAPHNLLSDPPFSHLDLIVCRNVLIYLQRDVQQDVLTLFHYALEPDGLLLLGTSETVDRTDLFVCEDKDARIFRKRNVPTRHPEFPLLQRAGPRNAENRPPPPAPKERSSYGQLHEQMVERYSLPSVLVNSEHEVVHASSNAGRYMQVPGGEPTANIFKLLREPLAVELRPLFHAVRQHRRAARSRPALLLLDGEPRAVSMSVRPATDQALEGFVLITFDECSPSAAPPGGTGVDQASTDNELEAELELSRQRLQAIIEEYEASREEMQASNEELQSANEELRSMMEELETSKEELQSMNEELTTVNQENRHRVEELSQLSSDLTNLMAATEIATLFLDRELRILRFTPQVGELFNVRRTDQGRPLADLTHRLGWPDLKSDAKSVLNRLTPAEREVRSDNGRWYLARILPYRGPDDRIEGVVITLIDITRRFRAEEELRAADRHKSEFLALLSHELRNPLAVLRTSLDLLKHSNEDEAGRRRRYEVMDRQLTHMVMLVDDLLDLTQISRGQLTLRRARVELQDLLRQAIENIRAFYGEAGHAVTTSLPDEPVYLDADAARITQVFCNVLGNAMKYTPTGGHIHITAETRENEAIISIKDDGIGIPPDKLETIFSMFVQLDKSVERHVQGGLGIGLTIVKQIV